jgi:hypothetical protein
MNAVAAVGSRTTFTPPVIVTKSHQLKLVTNKAGEVDLIFIESEYAKL